MVPDLEIGLEIGFVEAPLGAGEEVFGVAGLKEAGGGRS